MVWCLVFKTFLFLGLSSFLVCHSLLVCKADLNLSKGPKFIPERIIIAVLSSVASLSFPT